MSCLTVFLPLIQQGRSWPAPIQAPACLAASQCREQQLGTDHQAYDPCQKHALASAGPVRPSSRWQLTKGEDAPQTPALMQAEEFNEYSEV